MNSEIQVANNLLSRLLAGERGEVQLHLAMLLEKSSSACSDDDLYRRILPPDIADTRFSQVTCKRVVSKLCKEIARNPDEGLISVVCSSQAAQAIKTAIKVLIAPPRPLTLGEYAAALSPVTTFLPFYLADNSDFLPKEALERLANVTRYLLNIDDNETGKSNFARTRIGTFGPRLLRSLANLGIGDASPT